MITPEADHKYNILLSIVIAIFVVIAINSLFDCPRTIYITENHIGHHGEEPFGRYYNSNNYINYDLDEELEM